MSAAARTARVGLFAAVIVAGAAAVAVGQGPASSGSSGAASSAAAGAPSGAASNPASGAATPTWVAVPSGWRPMAELAPPRAVPAGSTVSLEAPAAFGDPALGCFALVQGVVAPAADFEAGRATERMIRDLGAAGLTIGAGATASDVPFAGRGFEGRMRVLSSAEGARVALRSVACFYNQREPARCRTVCQAMLDSAGARR